MPVDPVTAVLQRENRTREDLAVLLGDLDAGQLEALARASAELTRRRFGRTITLYAPLYLSNHCINPCEYCGFSSRNRFERTTMDLQQVATEAAALRRRGFGHILLLTGEDRRAAPLSYLEEAVKLCREWFAHISIEVYPLSREEYATLVAAGCSAVTLYQETFDRQTYAAVHPGGPKADYDARLAAPVAAAAAGMRGVGLGFLLGLHDWRAEALGLYDQAQAVLAADWRCRLAFSFPRLRPVAGGFAPKFPVSDTRLAQLVFAFRLLFPDAELVLSTRESPKLRDGFMGLGITRMSAGSITTVGGYETASELQAPEEQFSVHDHRSPGQMAQVIAAKGLDPVWKDWDVELASS